MTQPDIAYSMSIMSHYTPYPTIYHLGALEQIFCYLKVALQLGLLLYKDHAHTNIKCFSDANWARSREDKRSTSGYCDFVDGNLISCKSKKQNMVSCSSTESKYRAVAQSMCELVWIYQLLV